MIPVCVLLIPIPKCVLLSNTTMYATLCEERMHTAEMNANT